MTQRHIVRETYQFSTAFLAEAREHFGRAWDSIYPAHAVIRQVRVWTILGPRWVDAETVFQTWRTADAGLTAYAEDKVATDRRFRFRLWLNRPALVDEMWARARYATPASFRHTVDVTASVRIYWDPAHRTWTISQVRRGKHSMRLASSFDSAFTIADEMIV